MKPHIWSKSFNNSNTQATHAFSFCKSVNFANCKVSYKCKPKRHGPIESTGSMVKRTETEITPCPPCWLLVCPQSNHLIFLGFSFLTFKNKGQNRRLLVSRSIVLWFHIHPRLWLKCLIQRIFLTIEPTDYCVFIIRVNFLLIMQNTDIHKNIQISLSFWSKAWYFLCKSIITFGWLLRLSFTYAIKNEFIQWIHLDWDPLVNTNAEKIQMKGRK